jgi:hypothetical protein
MKSEFRIVVYKGEEYYISVDGHRKLNDIRLKIYDNNENKTLLYDNEDFNYETYFFFKNTHTRDLIVELSTTEASDPEEARNKYCVGVLIEFRNVDESPGRSEVGF